MTVDRLPIGSRATPTGRVLLIYLGGARKYKRWDQEPIETSARAWSRTQKRLSLRIVLGGKR